MDIKHIKSIVEIINKLNKDDAPKVYFSHLFRDYPEYEKYCLKKIKTLSVLLTYNIYDQLIKENKTNIIHMDLLVELKNVIYNSFYKNTDLYTPHNNPLYLKLHDFLAYKGKTNLDSTNTLIKFLIEEVIEKETKLTDYTKNRIQTVYSMLFNSLIKTILKNINEISKCECNSGYVHTSEISKTFYKKSISKKNEFNVSIEVDDYTKTFSGSGGIAIITNKENNKPNKFNTKAINLTSTSEYILCRNALSEASKEIISKLLQEKEVKTKEALDFLIKAVEKEKDMLLNLKKDIKIWTWKNNSRIWIIIKIRIYWWKYYLEMGKNMIEYLCTVSCVFYFFDLYLGITKPSVKRAFVIILNIK